MDKGYIRLSRKFFENAYWSHQRTFSLSEAWLDLIQMARFEAEPISNILPCGRQITIERGEVHASLRFLSNRWKWSVDKTKRYIDKHKEKGEIVHRSEQGESILKLCNYDIYNPMTKCKKNTIPNTDQTPTSTNNNKDNKEEYKETLSDERVKKESPLSGNSEKNISEVEKILLSDACWIETLCMNKHTEGFKYMAVNDVAMWISRYFRKLENEGERHKTIKDAKSHFANWWRIELEKTKNEPESANTGFRLHPALLD